jgi:hypothetical protein
MVGKSQEVRQGAIMPTASPTDLAQYCPDLEHWPERWHFDAYDIAPGQRIVEFFKPFLLHLLGQRLAANTLYRHRDHLWMLGGELIRRRYEDAKLKKMPVDKAIAELIEEDGGPLIWPRITEAQQNSFDTTCRKLYKFLNSTEKPVR